MYEPIYLIEDNVRKLRLNVPLVLHNNNSFKKNPGHILFNLQMLPYFESIKYFAEYILRVILNFEHAIAA